MYDLTNMSIELAMALTRIWHLNRRAEGLPYRPSPYGRRLRR